MQTAIAYREEQRPDGFQRVITLVALGYAGLVALAFYADYRIQLRRARKRKEAREEEEDGRRK